MKIMTEVGKGFEISLNNTRNILRIRAWGFWDTEFAKTYENTIKERVKEIGNGKIWYALADFRDFFPRSEMVQRIVNRQIAIAEKRGMKKIGYLGEPSGTQLKLNRLFRAGDMQRHAFFESETEAIEWLLNEGETGL